MNTPMAAPNLGLVGGRRGLTYRQFRAVCRILIDADGPGSLTGVQVLRVASQGAADAARIARWMAPVPRVIVHTRPRAEPTGRSPAAVALALDRDIIAGADVVIACPPAAETPRSLTWIGIRHARRTGRLVVVVRPDGTVEAAGREHYLVEEREAGVPVFVFLCRDPRADGYNGLFVQRVMLETLPPSDRSSPAGIAAARPVLGRSAREAGRYREFPSHKAMAKAGFQPVGRYRVCDTWDDYHFPWLGVVGGSSLDTNAHPSRDSTSPNAGVRVAQPGAISNTDPRPVRPS